MFNKYAKNKIKKIINYNSIDKLILLSLAYNNIED